MRMKLISPEELAWLISDHQLFHSSSCKQGALLGLSKRRVVDAKIENLDLELWQTSGAYFEGVSFAGSFLSGAEFHGCTFRDCSFDQCEMAKCDLDECRFIDCDFSTTNIPGAYIEGSVFIRSPLTDEQVVMLRFPDDWLKALKSD